MTLSEINPPDGYAVTKVTKVIKEGQAYKLGVKKGDKVVGIKGRDAISHANIVACLKHREVDVRLKLIGS